jgi:hypothetical protein
VANVLRKSYIRSPLANHARSINTGDTLWSETSSQTGVWTYASNDHGEQVPDRGQNGS